MLRNSRLRRDFPFPRLLQSTRTISAVPGAKKRFMTEQANAIGSREPAKDADLDFGGLAVRVSGADARAESLEVEPVALTGSTSRLSASASAPETRTAEIQIRDALMNRFSALGTAEIVRVD